MKKLLAIVLAAIMLCSMLLMTSCALVLDTEEADSKTTAKAQTETKAQTQAQTQPQTQNNGNGNGNGTGNGSGTGNTENNGETTGGSGSLSKEPINVDGTLVGDVDGDGDVDDFDVYIWQRMDFREMDGDGIRTKADVFFDGEVTDYIWKVSLDTYRKEYNRK